MKVKLFFRRKSITLGDIFILLYLIAFQVIGNGSLFGIAMKVSCAVVFIIGIIIRHKKIDAFSYWLFFYLLYVALSTYWALYRDYARQSTITVFYTVFCTFVITTFFLNNNKHRSTYVKISVFLPIIHYIYYLLSNNVQNVFNLRVGAVDQTYNNIGLSSAFSILFIMTLFAGKEIKNKFVYELVACIDLYLIVVCQSRKSFLYILVGVLIYFTLKSKDILKITLRIIIVLVLAIIFYFLSREGIFGTNIQNLIFAFEGVGQDSSYIGRMNQIDIAMDLFNKNPMVGSGIGAIEYVCRFIHGQKNPIVDSDYLDLLADLGIIGIVVFYGMPVLTLYKYLKAYKSWRNIDKACFAMLIVIFVNGAIIRSYFNNYTILLVLYYVYKNIVLVRK